MARAKSSLTVVYVDSAEYTYVKFISTTGKPDNNTNWALNLIILPVAQGVEEKSISL